MNNLPIKNEHLLSIYLTKPLEEYFYKKLPSEDKEYIKVKLCELLKFFMLSNYSYGDIPFTSEIDNMWHLWILQTVQYQELMQKLPNKTFIHHCSNDYNEMQREDNSDIEMHRQFSYLVSYVANFGEFTKETIKFWPMAMDLLGLMDGKIACLNNFLHQARN